MTQQAELPPSSNAPTLSKRAIELGKSASPIYEALFAKLFGKQYSPENPDGLLNLGVAENSLMAEWTLDTFKEVPLTRADLTYGDALAGSQRLYKGLSRLFEKYFHPITPVTEKHMVCGVGVSACLDQLVEKICDVGDTILISRPYYNGFDGDVSARSAARLIGVDLGETDQTSPKTLDAFEKTINDMEMNGEKPPRAIILCNPHNPLGHIYPKETIIEYCRFAERHNIHLIVDEIYALSLFKNKDVETQIPFQSILSIDVKKEAQCNPARIHVLYGMSKDFGANGLRIGVMVSQHNKDLIKSFMSSAILMKLSSPADALWSKILLNDDLLSSYIVKAQSRAADALIFAVEWLDKMKIPHSYPSAGHFIWCDFSQYLPHKDRDGKKLKTAAEREWELCRQLLFDHNVYVAPGSIYHSTKEGFFRLTFTIQREWMTVGLARVEKLLKKLKDESSE